MITHITDSIIALVESWGYVGVFALMTLESALIPAPSEIIMPFAGFLVSKGVLGFWMTVLVGALANVFGSVVSYYIGFLFKEEALLRWINKYGKFILLSEEDYRKAHAWFEKRGSGVAFFSRLLPGVRTFISLPAGIFRVNIWKFSLYTFVGSFIWSAFLTYIGFYLGTQWTSIDDIFGKLHVFIILGALALVGYFVYHQVHNKKTIV